MVEGAVATEPASHAERTQRSGAISRRSADGVLVTRPLAQSRCATVRPPASQYSTETSLNPGTPSIVGKLAARRLHRQFGLAGRNWSIPPDGSIRSNCAHLPDGERLLHPPQESAGAEEATRERSRETCGQRAALAQREAPRRPKLRACAARAFRGNALFTAWGTCNTSRARCPASSVKSPSRRRTLRG